MEGWSLARRPRRALLLGNSQYGSDAFVSLPGVEQDVRGMRALVGGTMGFHTRSTRYLGSTTVRTNMTRQQMIGAVAEFSRRVEQGDDVLVYYSGHSVRRGDTVYLVPAGTVQSISPSQSCVALDDIVRTISRSLPRLQLIFIDACAIDQIRRRGPIPFAATELVAKTTFAPRQRLGSNVFILHSAEPGTYAHETDSGGFFTNVMIHCVKHEPLRIENCAEIIANRMYIEGECRTEEDRQMVYKTQAISDPQLLRWPFKLEPEPSQSIAMEPCNNESADIL